MSTTTDLFIRQLEALRPQIEEAERRGERIRIKLYAAGEVGPPEFRALWGRLDNRYRPAVLS